VRRYIITFRVVTTSPVMVIAAFATPKAQLPSPIGSSIAGNPDITMWGGLFGNEICVNPLATLIPARLLPEITGQRLITPETLDDFTVRPAISLFPNMLITRPGRPVGFVSEFRVVIFRIMKGVFVIPVRMSLHGSGTE
jgi:hypothetical protein